MGEDNKWRAKALCASFDWRLFQVVEPGSPSTYGMRASQIWSYNQRNHQIARDICMDCPVFVECRESATHEDLRWTVRGGEGPEAPSVRTMGRKPPECNHRKLDPRTNWTSMKQADLPPCEECAAAADKIRARGVAIPSGTQ